MKPGGLLGQGGWPQNLHHLMTQYLAQVIMCILLISQKYIQAGIRTLLILVRDHVEASDHPIIRVDTLHVIVVILHPHLANNAAADEREHVAQSKLIHRSGRNTALGKAGTEVFLGNSVNLLGKPGGVRC